MDKIYRGWTVKVTAAMTFEIAGVPAGLEEREGMLRNVYDTYSKATAAIDHAMNLEKKRAAGRFTLKLAAVSLEGLPFTCTGINRTQRTFLGKPERPAPGVYVTPLSRDNLWPDVPWVRELLEQRQRLLDQISGLDDRLRPFEIAPAPRGFGRVPPELYEDYIEDLKKRYHGKVLSAQAAIDIQMAARELLAEV